jgi:pilus assembly protein Flp/PilA
MSRDRAPALIAPSKPIRQARPQTRGRNIMYLLVNLMNRLQSFVRDEQGQDLVEYAMLVALIALICVAGVTAAGTSVNSVFAGVSTKILGV